MFGLSTQELLIIFLIVLLLFGANRIPEIGRAMGKGIRDFKRATRDIEDEFKDTDEKQDPGRIQGKSGSEASSSQKAKEKTT
jgi:sec-independent protein translocase protein TatA